MNIRRATKYPLNLSEFLLTTKWPVGGVHITFIDRHGIASNLGRIMHLLDDGLTLSMCLKDGERTYYHTKMAIQEIRLLQEDGGGVRLVVHSFLHDRMLTPVRAWPEAYHD